MNDMFRIVNMTAVRYERGAAMVRGQRYSGVALERDNSGFFRAHFFKEGMPAKNWLSKYNITNEELWIPDTDDRLEYDYDELAMVDGEHFYGVVFEEDRGILRQLDFYAKNMRWVSIETNRQGEIVSIDCFLSGEYSFNYEVNGNGSLAVLEYSQHQSKSSNGATIRISGSDDFSASISVSGSLNQDFIDQFQDKTQFYSVNEPLPTEYRNLTFINCLVSMDSLIPIKNVLRSIGFEGAGLMTVFSMDVQQEALLEIIRFTKVKEVVFEYQENKVPVPPELIEAMTDAYPDLKVEVKNPQ